MKRFAVFDIDGTLVRWQLYHAIVDRLAARGVVSDQARAAIRQARMTWKKRAYDTSFSSYENAVVEEWLAESKKVSYEQYLVAVNEVVDEYIDQTYTYTRDLLKDLKQQGYFILTISGSPKEAVARVAEHHGFDDLVAAEFGVDDKGYLTGKNSSPIFDKAAVLKSLVEKHQLSFDGSVGVGDTHSDIAMLKLVDQPIAFNPEKRLAKHAEKHGWEIVVERKNVVYTLKYGHQGNSNGQPLISF